MRKKKTFLYNQHYYIDLTVYSSNSRFMSSSSFKIVGKRLECQ